MRLTPRSASLFVFLLACGDATTDDGSVDPASGHDAASTPPASPGKGGSDASSPLRTLDAGARDEPNEPSADDASVVRDGGVRRDGGRDRDGSVTPTPTSDAAVPSNELAQHCVDKINEYRATLKLAPLLRAADKEACVDGEAEADSISGKAHGAFGMCKESAQNECPGWPSKDMKSSLDGCLKQMWAEGPGDFNDGHGHYINMSSTKYKSVACGVHDIGNGKFWAIQDFF